jgi:membrane protein implicated in regulation of membrane protease activity
VLAGLAGALTVLRRRASAAQRQLALGALLFLVSGAAVLLMSDIFEFSWRYQVPALVTLPPAGALGIAVIIRYARRRKSTRSAAAAQREQRVTARTG